MQFDERRREMLGVSGPKHQSMLERCSALRAVSSSRLIAGCRGVVKDIRRRGRMGHCKSEDDAGYIASSTGEIPRTPFRPATWECERCAGGYVVGARASALWVSPAAPRPALICASCLLVSQASIWPYLKPVIPSTTFPATHFRLLVPRDYTINVRGQGDGLLWRSFLHD